MKQMKLIGTDFKVSVMLNEVKHLPVRSGDSSLRSE